MKELFTGMFADVVGPFDVLFSPPVLIAAVLILAAGLLGYFIGRSHRKKRKDQKEDGKS